MRPIAKLGMDAHSRLRPEWTTAVRLRMSNRWVENPGPSRPRVLRLYDHVGVDQLSELCSVEMTSNQYIASVVSTIAARLTNYCRRHNPSHVVTRQGGLITRVSYVYAVTHSKYFLDRFLALARNLEKSKRVIHGYVLRFLSRCDDDTRFVYSHVCFQTKWLLFRARGPRDKSHQLNKVIGRNRHPSRGPVTHLSKHVRTWAFHRVSVMIEMLTPGPTNGFLATTGQPGCSKYFVAI
jgi:hypothetical protein